MRVGIAFALAAGLAGNAQGAADVAVPLAPSGKWVVRYAPGNCTLSRDFGTAPDRLATLTLQPTTLGDTVLILATAPKGPAVRPAKSGKPRLTMLPAGTDIPIKYERHGPIGGGRTAAFMTINRADAPMLMAAPFVSVATDDLFVAITPSAGIAALDALKTCETKLLTAWGVDPAAVAAVATLPRGAADIGEWVRVADYPTSALRRRSQGASVILWQVGRDGEVSGCRTVESAGDAELDTAACRAIAKRARYSPALDKDGRPVASWVARTVTWSMPGS
jgi:TonB family protein